MVSSSQRALFDACESAILFTSLGKIFAGFQHRKRQF
jgi:hypothetical protein